MKKLLLIIAIAFLTTPAVAEELHMEDKVEFKIPLKDVLEKDIFINEYHKFFKQATITDDELKALGIQKGIITEDYTSDRGWKENNVVGVWLISERIVKLDTIDMLKKDFKQVGIMINRSPSFYVDEINRFLYNTIQADSWTGDIDKEGAVPIFFKSIAIMEGDFNDGRSRVEIFKEWFGENGFDIFEANCPGLHEALARKDEEELITKLGIVHIGMPKKKLYKIFRASQRKKYLKKDNEEWLVFSNWLTKKKGDSITFHLIDGKVEEWQRDGIEAFNSF